MPITTTNYVPVSRFAFLSGFAKGQRELRMLGITYKNLSGVDTLEALQALAKKQYHKISKYLHPDAHMRCRGMPHRQRPTEQTFQAATKAYQWVMSLTEVDLIRFQRFSKRQYLMDDEGKFRGSTVRFRGGMVYDCPLPWHFDRHVDYGYGYQESWEHVFWG